MAFVKEEQTWYRVYTGGITIEEVQTIKSNKRALWTKRTERPIKKDCVFWKHFESKPKAYAYLVARKERFIELAKLSLIDLETELSKIKELGKNLK